MIEVLLLITENKEGALQTHLPSRRSTVEIHRVTVNHRHMAVARGRDGSFGGQGAPRTSHKIEDMGVLKMTVAVVSAV